MSAEILDRCKYNSDYYDIIAAENSVPFTPKELGICTDPHVACWRGFFVEYYIIRNKLTLCNLSILSRKGYPTIKGKAPVIGAGAFSDFRTYKSLDMPVSYTGGLIMADRFMTEFYSNAGIQTPYCFKKVYELIFDSGDLIETIDHSKDMEKLREKYSSELNEKQKSDLFNDIRSAMKRSYKKLG